MSKYINYAEWLYGIALILIGVVLTIKGVESVIYMLTVESPDQNPTKIDFLPVVFIGLVVIFLVFRGVKKIQKEIGREPVVND